MKNLKNTFFITCLCFVLVSNLAMGNWWMDKLSELRGFLGSGCVITIKNLTKDAKIRVEAMDYIWDTDEDMPAPIVVQKTESPAEYVGPKQDLRHIWYTSAIGSNRKSIGYTLVIDTGDDEKTFPMNFLDESKIVSVGKRNFEVRSTLNKKFFELGGFTGYREVKLSVSDSGGSGPSKAEL